MSKFCAPVVVLCLVFAAGCARLPTKKCASTVTAGEAMTCAVPGYDDRDYDLIVPEDYKGEEVPLLIVLHGGGGNRFGALRVACPEADIDSAECLHQRALARGYAVVAPDGTPGGLGNFRTWNAGGGGDKYRCTSGRACKDGVDHVGYIEAVIAHVSERLAVDPKRVFATGISNGGAMSHRLACELSEQIAAVAPVGGAMQLTVHEPCAPSRPVPVLQVHGTEDPCWRFEGGVPICSKWFVGQPGKEHVPVMRSVDEWAEINQCSAETTETWLDDTEPDGTRTARVRWEGCAADTELLRIDGAGHTWPRGQQYLSDDTIGVVPQDWGSDVLLDWFDAHPMQ